MKWLKLSLTVINRKVSVGCLGFLVHLHSSLSAGAKKRGKLLELQLHQAEGDKNSTVKDVSEYKKNVMP